MNAFKGLPLWLQKIEMSVVIGAIVSLGRQCGVKGRELM